MHDLETAGTQARFAEAAHARAAREPLLLRSRKMKETQRQEARAVGDAAEQRATSPEGNLRELHLALDDGALTVAQRTDRHDARAVLVAQRQVKQQVLDGREPDALERRRERRTDAAQRRERTLRELGAPGSDASAGDVARRIGRHHAGLRDQSSSTPSISTTAPRGSATTPTVARAGYGCAKYSAMTWLTTGNLPRSVR